MTDQIRENETRTTNTGETDTYTRTLENAGTYENAGTVILDEGVTFTATTAITASGWSVSVTHPVTGRVIRPDVINPRDVQFIPGPNSLPRVRLPVRSSVEWLDTDYDDNPALAVYLDGTQLPIDELVDVEHGTTETILVGEGGTELRTRVSAEYDSEERPVAVTDLVDAHTSYATVDNTTAATESTSTVQSPSGESELGDLLTIDSVTPLTFTAGGVKPLQTCFTVEGENATTKSGTSLVSDTAFSNGDAESFTGTGQSLTFDFTLGHDIPSGEFGFQFRAQKPTSAGNSHRLSFKLDGTEFGLSEVSGSLSLDWYQVSAYTDPGAVSAGSHTITIESTETNSDDIDIDVVAPYDDRYVYTFDNVVNTSSGYLDGPELYPVSVDAVFDAYESAFNVVAGEVSVTVTDTTGGQAVALSNDFGATYPLTASNSSTVSGPFPDAGASLNLKASLGRYSPSGTRDQTPREGYDAQRLDAYTLDATERLESLLIDQSFDDRLVNVTNDILGSQFIWKYSLENGTPTVTVTEPGNAVTDSDPEISNQSITKRLETIETVTVKGSPLPVSGEPFQASSSFVDLVEDNIVTGSEAVYDDTGTQYTRGVDYEINYGPGEIKALSGGDLTTGTDYNVDYRHRAIGSHTVTGVTGEQLVRSIPGVVSDRQAEQIAYVLAEVEPELSVPRFEGDIVVPRLDVTFDPLEALNLESLGLPDAATPLSIRGSPEVTPLGLRLRLGSAPRLEASLSAIREQVSAVSNRT